MKRAWLCRAPRWFGSDQGGLYKAETAERARYLAHRSALDAGFPIPYRDIRARRAPDLDNVDFTQGIMPMYVRRTQ